MGEVAKSGRTVLFVSHNMGAVTRLCSRAILLKSAQLEYQGESSEVIAHYLKDGTDNVAEVRLPPDSTRPMKLREISLLNREGQPSSRIEINEPFRVRVVYDINRPISSAHVICFFINEEGVNVLGSGDADCNPERLTERRPGQYEGTFEVPAFLLGEGRYSIDVSLSVPFVQVFDRPEGVIMFEITDTTSRRREWQHKRRPGVLGIELPWQYEVEPIMRAINE